MHEISNWECKNNSLAKDINQVNHQSIDENTLFWMLATQLVNFF